MFLVLILLISSYYYYYHPNLCFFFFSSSFFFVFFFVVFFFFVLLLLLSSSSLLFTEWQIKVNDDDRLSSVLVLTLTIRCVSVFQTRNVSYYSLTFAPKVYTAGAKFALTLTCIVLIRLTIINYYFHAFRAIRERPNVITQSFSFSAPLGQKCLSIRPQCCCFNMHTICTIFVCIVAWICQWFPCCVRRISFLCQSNLRNKHDRLF